MSLNDNLVYLCYGDSLHTYEVLFSMLTLARFSRDQLRGVRVFAVTDRPDLFLANGLDVLPVPTATINEWKGPFDFGHRCKILAIRHVIEKYGGRCLLVDGDTYFTRPPRRVFQRIGPSRSVMHMPIGRLADSRHEMNHRFGELLEDDTLRRVCRESANRGRATIQWNAGVLGLNSSDVDLLDEVLCLVDSILPRFVAPAVEQLAFSIVLAEKTRLQASRDAIFHYNVSPDREIVQEVHPRPP